MKNLIVIMNNSVSSVSGQNRNNFKFFSGGPEEKEIRVRRAGQLAAAGAAANCDASIGCSIPRRSAKPGAGRALTASAKEVRFPSVLRQALRGRDSASAGGYRAVGASLPSACQPRKRRAKCEAASIRCGIPCCTRSDSGAGGGRLPDAAQEVLFPVPASRASYNSAGASERSACQPRQRRAKGDAASIRCGIPLSQECVMRPGDNFRGPGFYGVDERRLDNGIMDSYDERIKEFPKENQPTLALRYPGRGQSRHH